MVLFLDFIYTIDHNAHNQFPNADLQRLAIYW